jgi:hypothetical protein
MLALRKLATSNRFPADVSAVAVGRGVLAQCCFGLTRAAGAVQAALRESAPLPITSSPACGRNVASKPQGWGHALTRLATGDPAVHPSSDATCAEQQLVGPNGWTFVGTRAAVGHEAHLAVDAGRTSSLRTRRFCSGCSILQVGFHIPQGRHSYA